MNLKSICALLFTKSIIVHHFLLITGLTDFISCIKVVFSKHLKSYSTFKVSFDLRFGSVLHWSSMLLPLSIIELSN